jgi:hypothetical protein
MSIFKDFILIVFIPNHTTCCHIISCSYICKQIDQFHNEINFQPKNVKRKSLVTLRMALINLFTPRCAYGINLIKIHLGLKFCQHWTYF